MIMVVGNVWLLLIVKTGLNVHFIILSFFWQLEYMLGTMALQLINASGNVQLEQVTFIILIFKALYSSNNTCVDCHYSCKSCSLPNNKTACLSRKENTYLLNSTCVECDVNTYLTHTL